MRIVLTLITLLLLGVGCGATKKAMAPPPQSSPIQGEEENVGSPPLVGGVRGGGEGQIEATPHPDPLPQGEREIVVRTDFSEFNPVFRFSAEIANTWQVEYVSEIEALNIYGPAQVAMPPRELSKIFIRYFEANDFLTLRTVDILERDQLEVQGHPAVRYTIQKKAGVADFSHQPSWRNETHEVTDVRLIKNNPSIFYVFGRNPAVSQSEFEKFLQSIQFHNDPTSIRAPLDRARERVTKKPFGLKVTPENSPVSPERFSGYHTGADFETFDDEKDKDVEVRAFCGGPIRERRTADGYGGVVVQECLLSDQAVTVVYGHLNIASVDAKVGEYVAPGDELGALGAAFSSETDGERKHLHFGIHKGTSIDLRGYVARNVELDQWLNPWQYIPTQ